MKYIAYNPEGNTVGLKTDFVDYWEINDSGRILRSVNIRSDGTMLRYDEEHSADVLGALPEGLITDENLSDPSYGTSSKITKEEFETLWAKSVENR